MLFNLRFKLPILRLVTALSVTVLVVPKTTRIATAHEGRRFEVSVVAGQLLAEGVNTGPDDGAPAVRPYPNAIHDHWLNSPVGNEVAFATLPGFDFPHPPSDLVDHPLYVTLLDVHRWVNPPTMPTADTIPRLSPLAPGEIITITGDTQTIDSTNRGTLLLAPAVTAGGIADLDFIYEINSRPQDVIHVLTVRLEAPDSVVQSSDPIYILLSPDGADPATRLHHASLFLEARIADIAVPEPASCWLLALFSAGVICSRRCEPARN